MTTNNKTDDIKGIVEEVGVYMEQKGMSPMPGRVFAYLLLSEPPYRTFYEIQDFLKASKSAISNALRVLMDSSVVDYITFSGDRKRYFKVNTANWLKVSIVEANKAAQMQLFLERVLAMRQNSKHLEFNEGLEKVLRLQEFLAQRIPELIDEFEDNYLKE